MVSIQRQSAPINITSRFIMKRWITIPETGIVLVLVLLCAFFQLSNPVFLSWPNVTAMLRGMSYTGLVGIGMAFCLISGVIDLSVGATAALSSVVFAYSMVHFGLSPVAAGIIALAMSTLVGFINGWVITRMKVTPFIMTICSMYIIRGIASWISNGYSIYPLPFNLVAIGSETPLDLSWAFIIMVIFMILGAFMLDGTVWGLMVRATGSDKESAKCTEVNVDLIHKSVFMLTGFVAGIAGILLSFLMNAGVHSAGSGWELTAIAACAIGGISLFGYQGNFFGLFCGLLTLQVIQNGIVVIGINPYSQSIVIGLILVISMIAEVKRRQYFNLESL